MRVVVFIQATQESEAGVMPGEAALEEMGRFKAELARAGVLLGGEGLHPSSKGRRLHVSGARKMLVDGPFAEAKELVGGYWLWKVESLDEATEWAKRCVDCMPAGEWVLEIRPLFELEDFGALTPGLRAQEHRLRAELERQQGTAETGSKRAGH